MTKGVVLGQEDWDVILEGFARNLKNPYPAGDFVDVTDKLVTGDGSGLRRSSGAPENRRWSD